MPNFINPFVFISTMPVKCKTSIVPQNSITRILSMSKTLFFIVCCPFVFVSVRVNFNKSGRTCQLRRVGRSALNWEKLCRKQVLLDFSPNIHCLFFMELSKYNESTVPTNERRLILLNHNLGANIRVYRKIYFSVIKR